MLPRMEEAGMWRAEDSESQEPAFNQHNPKPVKSPSATGWGHFFHSKGAEVPSQQSLSNNHVTRHNDVQPSRKRVCVCVW